MSNEKAQAIYDEMFKYIEDNGGVFSQWYCGITDNIERRVFEEHKVRKGDLGLHDKCPTKNDAQLVEKALLENGCDGGTGGGNSNSKCVYIYKKELYTVDQ